MPINRLYIFMGVSGSGKSTIAQAFANRLGIDFYDADDFHSTQARAHMQSGQALTDNMREPWIARIIHKLELILPTSNSCTLAYSGLRAHQRQAFLALDAQVIFFHLRLPQNEARHRVSKRIAHFFPPNLISHQYDSLEPAMPCENIVELDATLPLDQLLKQLDTFVCEMPVFNPPKSA